MNNLGLTNRVSANVALSLQMRNAGAVPASSTWAEVCGFTAGCAQSNKTQTQVRFLAAHIGRGMVTDDRQQIPTAPMFDNRSGGE